MGKEEILQDMLNGISNEYDKRPGSYIYDALAPVAWELEKTFKNMGTLAGKLSAENLSDEELSEFVRERSGITRKEATFATGFVTVKGTGTINKGALFETLGGVQFQASETKSIKTSGTLPVEAIITGESGNVAAGTITLFPVTLAGFTAVTNTEPVSGGIAEESDDDLRQRYYDRIRTPATSGNVYHYKNWSLEVKGVGAVKVFPIWNGPGTVKVVIVDSNRHPASPTLVSNVSNYLETVRPIGATVTVESANGLGISVSALISLATGYSLQTVKAAFIQQVEAHLREIAFEMTYVSYARIGTLLLGTPGVIDYTSLLVNNGINNIALQDDEVPVLGLISLGV